MSNLFKLNWRDVLLGLVMAVIGAILTAIYQALLNGGVISLQTIGTVGLLAGLSYIIKNFFSDDTGKVLGKI